MSLQNENMMKNESLRKKAQGQLKSLFTDCEIQDFQKKKLLEIGFKNGLFLDECHKAGLTATGLEISSQYFQNVKKEFPHLDLFHYDGGKFPFPDSSFDMVVSFQVIEHVNSIEHIIKECLRILKPGGTMYHVCPNYHSFYEGHYNILWLPFLNKKTARIYLKLLKKYVHSCKELDLTQLKPKDVWCGHNSIGEYEVKSIPGFEYFNLIKPNEIIKILTKYNGELELISLGKKEFIAKFNREQIQKIRQKFLRKTLEILNFIPGIRQFVLWFICWAGFYYPLVIILKKKFGKKGGA